MKSTVSISLVIIIAIAVLTFESAYKVEDNNYAVITQVGKPVKVVKNAGWHFKIPFLQQVHYEQNTLEISGESFQELTKEENAIDVQSKNQNKIQEAPPRKIVQIKPVETSELNCPTRIVDNVEQVVMLPGMSTMQYNLCNEKLRRITLRRPPVVKRQK